MKESYIFGHCGIFLHELHHTVGQLEGRGKHSKHTQNPNSLKLSKRQRGSQHLSCGITHYKKIGKTCFPWGDVCQMCVSTSTHLHGLQSFHGTQQVCTYHMRVFSCSRSLPFRSVAVASEHRGDGGYVCVCLRWKE